MSRAKDWDGVMLAMAFSMARMATCCKLGVGCILTDRTGRVLSAGVNGPASGRQHCTGQLGDPFDMCYKHCQATHAESNAIISCHAPARYIRTCYTTWSPCVHCCKQLIQTGCTRIVFAHESQEHEEAREFWMRRAGAENRSWERFVSSAP